MTQVQTNAAPAAGGIPAADLARGAAPTQKADPRGRGGEPPVDRASLRSRLSRNQTTRAESATAGLEGPAPINDCGGVEGHAIRSDWLRRKSGNVVSQVGIKPGPQPPTTRAEARAAGLKFYFGVACAYGHHRRYSTNGMCVACSAASAVARRLGTRRPPPPPAPPEHIAPDLLTGRYEGVNKYHGRPHTCGSTVRYVCSTKCVQCQNARRAAARQRSA